MKTIEEQLKSLRLRRPSRRVEKELFGAELKAWTPFLIFFRWSIPALALLAFIFSILPEPEGRLPFRTLLVTSNLHGTYLQEPWEGVHRNSINSSMLLASTNF